MKEKFTSILTDDEKIIWANQVNTKAASKHSFISNIWAIALFIVPAIVMIPFIAVNRAPAWILIFPLIPFLIVYTILIWITIKSANNTYFAITDKRIIKRYGAFANKYVHYSLKNAGNVEAHGTIYDKKDTPESATLIITVKDFHNDTSGYYNTDLMIINHLECGYEAYKTLTKLIEGNNEKIRVSIKNEK